MNILALIPARSGSKGVPGKNTKLLGGKPLLAYTIEQALEVSLFSKVILSTDCEQIAAVGKEWGAEIPFIRPASLATDSASSIGVVQHALDFYKEKGETFDAVCLLQPTTPFRAPHLISECIQKMKTENWDAVVSMLPVPHEFNPHWVFESDEKGALHIATGEKEIIKRRQELPNAYFRDGAVYLTRTEWLEKGSFFGEKLGFVLSNPTTFVNIDTLSDWDKAEQLIQQLKENS
ncbi:acylneuraminate cytidylyltransferase family protein [Flavobacterium stagni]|uniref:Acylneuraminate cytidylyltransferase family protein n=1 Tax=Flavobacterium stagni TaxID=2506421 RepID=A0A4V1N2H7_9FLAO|nr:acylneuraminate cytidylyltransferase family protein [Flavobacterium stagni]RXR21862.1 acylneuraminate cytidylyltransferase family protein [Flavobacterium stagni]